MIAISIYPRKLTKNENCIIHLRFNNFGKNVEVINYLLKIYNPLNKLVFSKKDKVLLGTDKSNFIKDLYNNITIEDDFIPGKYYVEFIISCKGNKYISTTKETDFFVVEQLDFYIDDNNILHIFNLSNESIKFILYNEDMNKENFLLDSKSKIELNGKYKFIEYGNNEIFVIKNKRTLYYLKNPNIKVEYGRLIDIMSNKVYSVSEGECLKFKQLENVFDSKNIESEIINKFLDLEIIYLMD